MSNNVIDEMMARFYRHGYYSDNNHDSKQFNDDVKVLNTYIHQIIVRSRIDELEHILDCQDVYSNFDPEINPITIDERIKQLKGRG